MRVALPEEAVAFLNRVMILHRRVAVQPFVHVRQVVVVDEVLHRELPVRFEVVRAALGAAQGAEVVPRPPLFERGDVVGELGGTAREVHEYEAVPHRAAHPRESVDGFGAVPARPVEVGRTHESAVERVGPGMVRAGEARPSAHRFGEDLQAAIPAVVVKHMDGAGRVAGHDDALAGDLARRGVAAFGNVVHEPDADPAVREQGATLAVEESFRRVRFRRQTPRLFNGALDGIEVRIDGHGRVVLSRAHRA